MFLKCLGKSNAIVKPVHYTPLKMDWFVFSMLLGAASYLYLNLFAFPITPFLLGGDQTYFWMNAQRMLYGERVYQDFFQFTPPGADLLYLGLFKLFGLHVWVTNVAVLALGLALCWVCFALAGEIMERRLALLATFLFLTFVYSKQLNGTHHWFSVLAVMCAARIGVWKRMVGGVLAAGGMLGLASFFTQTRGVVALLAFATFLTWERSRTRKSFRDLLWNQLLLALGFAIVLLLLSAYFIATVGLKQLWYFQVTYVGLYMVHGLQTQFMGLPDPIAWRTLPKLAQYLTVYMLLPVIYPVVLWRCWRDRRNPLSQWEQVALLSVLGSFLLVEVASGLNWLRLFAVSMPGIILLIWAVGRTGKARQCVVALMWVVVAGLAVRQTWSRHFHEQVTAKMPGGMTATIPQTNEKLQWMVQHTAPGQFFFQAAGPALYLPLQLRNPVFMDAVETNKQTRPEHIKLAIQQLEARHVQFVLWSPRLDEADDRPTKDAIAALSDYLRERYVRVHVFSDQDVVWQRK
jgi:hypothetical protein